MVCYGAWQQIFRLPYTMGHTQVNRSAGRSQLPLVSEDEAPAQIDGLIQEVLHLFHSRLRLLFACSPLSSFRLQATTQDDGGAHDADAAQRVDRHKRD